MTRAGDRGLTRAGERELARAIVRACLLALLLLVALWAFVSHLEPAFSGERVSGFLLCN